MTEAPILRVDVTQVPSSHLPRALTALDFLGCSIGARIVLSQPHDAHLSYGGPSEGEASPRVWIPFWGETYDPSARHQLTFVDGLPCWLPEDRRDGGPPDFVGATWRLLTLADESQIAAASGDAWGRFSVSVLPPARRASLDEPFAEWHADAMLRRLEAGGVRLGRRVARWPNGKRYAVLVTHDTEGPRLQQPGELAKALAKAIVRRSASERRAFGAGLTSKLMRRPDPYFAFDAWTGVERELGLRSAFYLYVRSRVPRHARDPLYVIDRHPRWDVLRKIADDGWELGVHAGIRAGETADGLRAEREALGRLVGRPVYGLRHHYWRLDWRSPSRTFERQVAAGYEYDCSIAWSDRPGLRAGTSLPYFPCTPDGDRLLELIEVPTTLMDGHLFEYLRLDPDAATEAAERIHQRVAGAGGVFNIDWHERTFCDRFSYDGWATVAFRILRTFSSDAWLATPIELVRWWRSRAASVGLPEIRGR